MKTIDNYRGSYSQYEKQQNTKEVNNLILKIMWMFLCIPILVMILSLLGVFKVSWQFALRWFFMCAAINCVLQFLKMIKVSENTLKYSLMAALEAIVIITAREPLMGVYSTYILVPIISCAYLDKRFTQRISAAGYVLMILGLWLRSEGAIRVDYQHYTRLRWVISFSSGYTLEYIALFGAIKLLSHRTENFVDNLTLHSQKIISMQHSTISSFADLIESRDDSTGQHVKRTSGIVSTIVDGMKEIGLYQDQMTNEYCELICQAAPLHDVGKIKISDAILCKPGRLTEEEFTIIKTHTTAGADIVTKSLIELEEKEFIQVAKEIALYHHEKWDGSGYPEGIKSHQIPISARIMAVADVFDALISKRCYKESMELKEAFDIIQQGSGSHFDPAIVEVFIKQEDKIKQLIL